VPLGTVYEHLYIHTVPKGREKGIVIIPFTTNMLYLKAQKKYQTAIIYQRVTTSCRFKGHKITAQDIHLADSILQLN